MFYSDLSLNGHKNNYWINMVIFLATHFQGNRLEDSKTWYNNLVLPLMDIAEKVILFDFDLFGMSQHQDESIDGNKGYNSIQRPKLEIELIRQVDEAIKSTKIDAFISYFASSYCDGSVIEYIKSKGIVTINWFCNASYQFKLVDKIAPYYDYCLVPERDLLNSYQLVKANPIYFQESANPKIYFPTKINQKYAVSFYGQRYADRFSTLRFVQNRIKEKITIAGSNWQPQVNKNILENSLRKLVKRLNFGSAQIVSNLKDDDLNSFINSSQINLGFSKVWNDFEKNPIKQVRLRDFEIPMAGGFYLTEQNDELSSFFEPNKEIVFFDNQEDLLSKIKYYLKHDEKRKSIAHQAYLRSVNEHTSQVRWSNFFKSIGILKG